jgi:hypothetical protein
MSTMRKFCPSEETLSAWIEESLPEQERAGVTAHLATCDDCRRTVAIASGLEGAAPGEVDEELLQRVAAQARRRPWWNWAAAAALLVAFGIAFAFSRPAQKEPLGVSSAPPSWTPAGPPDRPQPAPSELARAPEPTPLPVPTARPPTLEPAPGIPPPPPVPSEKPAVPKETAPVAKAAPSRPEPPRDPAPPALTAVPKVEPEPPPGYNPVFVIEPAGDLWVKRDEGEAARVGAVERISARDAFSARVAAAAFTLEGRASVALEKGTQASFSYNKPEDAFALGLSQGMVLVDTEGSSQRWQIQCGGASLTLRNLNGRFSVEPRGALLAATVLEGRGEAVVGSVAQKVEAGKEIVLSRDGALFTERSGDASRKLARLVELRPKLMTAFSANFREKEETRLFGFQVAAGRMVLEPTAAYLRADQGGTYPKAGEKAPISLALRPDRPVTCAAGMVLRFRYRTTFPNFTVRLGKFSVLFTPKGKSGQWTDGEIPLSAFEFEGVPMVPSDEAADLQLSASLDKKIGLLDLEGVQFVRRAR